MKTNVGVLFGGRSVEHEISIISALQAIAAFDKTRYQITPIYISKQGKWYSGEIVGKVESYKDMANLQKQATEVYMMPEFGNYTLYKKEKSLFGSNEITKFDILMPVLHGTNGEDGTVQGLIELIGIPYVGCNPLASVNGMDKIIMKMVMRESGIPTVDFVWFTDREWNMNRQSIIEKIEKQIGYPVIVKPANLGSSVGISRAANREALTIAIDEAEKFSTRLLAEKMVDNLREINCSVLGDCDTHRPSVCEEPIKSGDILSYKDKYLSGGGSKGGAKGSGTKSQGMQSTQRRIPADLAPNDAARIQHLACETFRVLSCNGVSRIDFIIDASTNEIYVNEINTIPGSLSFYLWEASGVKFEMLMDELINLALKRHREAALKTVSYDNNIFNMSSQFTSGKFGPKQK